MGQISEDGEDSKGRFVTLYPGRASGRWNLSLDPVFGPFKRRTIFFTVNNTLV
jgi:hypothetical protein